MCNRDDQGINIYTSPALGSLVINPGTKIALPLQLKSIFTQALGEKHISCTINFPDDQQSFNNTRSGTFAVVETQRFDLAMERSIELIK